MHNPLVRYSRAGDVFHYRWAARRCLRLLDLNCPLECITIEGSREGQQPGEYVIDVAEYSRGDQGPPAIAYFQLKHSTVRTRIAMSLGELKDTLRGFVARYRAELKPHRRSVPRRSATFSVVTNRRISQRLKDAIRLIGSGQNATPRLQRELKDVTGLDAGDLQRFCVSLHLVDGEGDYIVQKERLQSEVAEYIAGFVDTFEIDKLIALVQDRALPQSGDGSPNGEIHREDVLSRLNVSSERDLFPAPPRFEPLRNSIRREQHNEVLRLIETTESPLVIHADGGVGKTVAGRQLAGSLREGSLGIVYDCFGGGTYRNASEPRHRASDGLIEIANELAVRGHCRTLIGPNQSMDALFRAFLDRLAQATESLREITDDALLVIFVDAADNAEMAAADVGEKSFVRFLLRERLPKGCRLVLLCRTERIDLLAPPANITRYLLDSFSKEESAAHLRQSWPGATERDVLEFHRLTGGNPRVQATALATQHRDLNELLMSLGPLGTSVDEQIGAQLGAAVAQIRHSSPDVARSQIDAICSGLANLPPFIPVDVLAQAADVHPSTVRSFVSDLGRPLWLSDNSVQFRDEPTEHWFRSNFSATSEQITAYVRSIEPLAKTYAYVSRSLPQLLLKAGEHRRLIELALSDELLPENSPIDERDIRVYRLQFAFRAALKLKHYADAARLALRAAEEAAGDKRQVELLQGNIDLIAPLQDAHRVQELAYRQRFSASWEGSGNVYAAALLSSVPDFKGEARAYLRAADRWLHLYFEHHNKTKHRNGFPPQEVTDDDLVEFASAALNLFGPPECVKFLVGWQPVEVVFRITRLLVRRLVDANRYDEIEQIASRGSKSVYLILALTYELGEVAKFPSKRALTRCLGVLANEKTRIPSGAETFDRTPVVPSIISFAEACARQRLSSPKIRTVLKHYVSEFAHPSMVDRHGGSPDTFLRAAALRRALDRDFAANIESLFPPDESGKEARNHDKVGEDRDLRQTLEALFPLYLTRARLLCGSVEPVDYQELVARSQRELSGRYQRFDRLPQQISLARFEVMAVDPAVEEQDIERFTAEVIRGPNDRFHLGQRLSALRVVARQQHLNSLEAELEASARRTIEMDTDEGPGQRADLWVQLARAVLPISKADSAAYLALAVEAVSKFGDEVVERWRAIISLANRAAGAGRVSDEVVYRFFRVAEVVGDAVAREKYWDRDEVFTVGLRLGPAAAFAAISRWRDRHVGFLSSQLLSLVSGAVTTGVFAADVGWCFSGFFGCYASSAFGALCIDRAASQSLKQAILDGAVRDLELNGPNGKDALVLKECAQAHGLNLSRIDGLLNDLNQIISAEDGQIHLRRGIEGNPDPPICSSATLLEGLDLTTADGVAEAIRRFDDLDKRTEFQSYWREIIRRIPTGGEMKFLDALLLAQTADVYDVIFALESLGQAWSEKVAVKRGWPLFARKLGRRFALQLSNTERLHHWLPIRAWDQESLVALREGVIEGLSESLEILSATTLFGFVTSIAESLTPEQAADVLEFGLSRFEIHIAQDYGDGAWSEWLRPPEEISDALTGFIWSALGSPDSAERWQAVHAVRRLVAFSRSDEITSLFQWLQNGGVAAFGSQRFPFYRLHAMLYLLIGVSRAAIDNPYALMPHANLFTEIALGGTPHILIQRAAAGIAILLEEASAGTYRPDVMHNLRGVGQSPFPLREVKDPDSIFPLSSAGLTEHPAPDFHLSWDFDDYWIKYLANLFAVDKEQLISAAKTIAAHDLGVGATAGYLPDPRRELWNSGSYGYWATSHDHGSYPRVDDYPFYYSYNAFFSLAAQLLNSVPVVRRTGGYWEDDPDPWGEWLSRHWLTRSDGRWLSDRRDPTPARRRQWLSQREREQWLWSIMADDFVDCIAAQTSLPQSLCIAGYWVDHDNYRVETIRISSALVNRDTAAALASAMRTCEHPYNCRLPSYAESDAEETHHPFELTGWIVDCDGSETRLDAFDPHAREVRYPPLEIGESFASLLNLSPDLEKRDWRQDDKPDVLIRSETWSDEKPWRRGEREEPFRHGLRMCASTALVKQLCRNTDKDLIVEVQISRREERSYSKEENDYGYLDPSHKVFLFSSDGILKDAGKSHQLG